MENFTNPNITNIPADFRRLGTPTAPIKTPRSRRPLAIALALATIALAIATAIGLLLVISCVPSGNPVAVRVTPTLTLPRTRTAEVPTATTGAPATGGLPGGSTSSTPIPGSPPVTGGNTGSTPITTQPTSTSTSPPSSITVLATDTSHWQYTGSWTIGPRMVCKSGTCMISGQKNATASITFTGTSITLLGGKNQNGGIGNVKLVSTSGATLDSATFDCYSATPQQATLYSKSMERGTYTLTVTVTGTADAHAANSNILLDSVIVQS